MLAKIVNLFNRDRTGILYPVTTEEAVYNENDVPIAEELKKYRTPDSKPTKDSEKFVTSGGLYQALKVNGQVNYGTTGNTTKIKIKIKSTESWMLNFTVTLYQGYRSTKFMISGYNYGNNYWYNPKAVILGDSGESALNVYFGYDSVSNLWVGFDGGSYTGIKIDGVTNGYTQLQDFNDLFEITTPTSFSGTTQYTQSISKAMIPVNPNPAPTVDGSIWITT